MYWARNHGYLLGVPDWDIEKEKDDLPNRRALLMPSTRPTVVLRQAPPAEGGVMSGWVKNIPQNSETCIVVYKDTGDSYSLEKIAEFKPPLVGDWLTHVPKADSYLIKLVIPSFTAKQSLSKERRDTYWLGNGVYNVQFVESAPPIRHMALSLSNEEFLSLPPIQFGTSEFTLECWIKTTSHGVIFSSGTPSTNQLLVVLQANGQIYCYLLGHTYTFQKGINDGKWHHIAFVRYKDTMGLFVDGKPQPNQDTNFKINQPIDGFAAVDLSQQSDLYVGSAVEKDMTYLTADIDELRIWDSALSNGTIVGGMNKIADGTEPGLLGHWSFDQNHLYDSSPYERVGKIEKRDATPTPTIIEAQQDFLPPAQPYLVVQTSLMEDYDKDHGPIDAYRVVISAYDGADLPVQTSLKLKTQDDVEIQTSTDDSIQLQTLSATSQSPYTFQTNTQGQFSFAIHANGKLETTLLHVQSDFMTSEEWLAIAPDRHVHYALSKVTGKSLQGKTDPDYPYPVKKSQKLLGDKFTEDQASHVANAIRHVMSSAVEHTGLEYDPLTRDLPDLFAVHQKTPPRKYEDVYIAGSAYDAHSNVAASYYMSSSSQHLHRIVEPDAMANPNWGFNFDNHTFSAYSTQQAKQQLQGLTIDRSSDPRAQAINTLQTSYQKRTLEQWRTDYTTAVGKRDIEGAESIIDWFEDKFDKAKEFVVETIEHPLETAEHLAQQVVKVIVVTFKTIENAVEQAYQFVVQTVKDAVSFIKGVFKKLGVAIQSVINFVKGLFEWEDIQQTQKILHTMLQGAVLDMKTTVIDVKTTVLAELQTLNTTIYTHLDAAAASLGNKILSDQQSTSQAQSHHNIRANYLSHMTSNHLNSSKTTLDTVNDSHQSLFDDIKKELQKIYTQEKTQFEKATQNTNIHSLLSDPRKLIMFGLEELITLLKGLIDVGMLLLQKALSIVFDFIVKLIEFTHATLNTRINIPIVTDFCEKIVLPKGQKLTLYGLIALAGAVPYTILHKLINLTTCPPFPTKSSKLCQAFPANFTWDDYKKGLAAPVIKVAKRSLNQDESHHDSVIRQVSYGLGFAFWMCAFSRGMIAVGARTRSIEARQTPSTSLSAVSFAFTVLLQGLSAPVANIDKIKHWNEQDENDKKLAKILAKQNKLANANKDLKDLNDRLAKAKKLPNNQNSVAFLTKKITEAQGNIATLETELANNAALVKQLSQAIANGKEFTTQPALAEKMDVGVWATQFLPLVCEGIGIFASGTFGNGLLVVTGIYGVIHDILFIVQWGFELADDEISQSFDITPKLLGNIFSTIPELGAFADLVEYGTGTAFDMVGFNGWSWITLFRTLYAMKQHRLMVCQ